MNNTTAKLASPTNARTLHLLFVLSGLVSGVAIGRVTVVNPISMHPENWEALVVNLTIICATLLTAPGIIVAKSLYKQGAYKLGWLCSWVGYAALGSVIGSAITAGV